MVTPSIYEIKTASHFKSPYFFSRDSMRFFGQTMRSFKVVKSPTDRIFLYAAMRADGRLMGYTFREFVPATGELLLAGPHCDSLADVQNFIKNN